MSTKRMHKAALVTGGAGFVGSHLTKSLISDGYHVTVIDNLSSGSLDNLKDVDQTKVTFINHDVIEPYDDIGNFDLICNLACPASPPFYQRSPIHTWKTSVIGTLNAVELAKKCNATLFHTSTSEVYGDPDVHPQPEKYWGHVNPIGIRACYDEGKRAAETLLSDAHREYGLDVRVVRFFNTYGPNMDIDDGRVVTNFIKSMLRNEPLTIYGVGDQTRSFQYIDDCINACMKFINKTQQDIDEFCRKRNLELPVLNIGNPREFTIVQLAELIMEQNKEFTGGLTYHDLPKDDPQQRKPDISLAKEFLGWEPVITLEEGLERTTRYFKQL